MAKSKFVEGIVKILKGDDAETLGKKIQKSAKGYIKAQIAIKEANSVKLEDAVERAEESKIVARMNGGKQIVDENAYISSLFEAENALNKANKDLENNKKEVELLKKELSEIEA